MIFSLYGMKIESVGQLGQAVMTNQYAFGNWRRDQFLSLLPLGTSKLFSPFFFFFFQEINSKKQFQQKGGFAKNFHRKKENFFKWKFVILTFFFFFVQRFHLQFFFFFGFWKLKNFFWSFEFKILSFRMKVTWSWRPMFKNCFVFIFHSVKCSKDESWNWNNVWKRSSCIWNRLTIWRSRRRRRRRRVWVDWYILLLIIILRI